MDNLTAEDTLQDAEQRIAKIENALKFDERIQSLESALMSKGVINKPAIPWWKDSKTITILGAFIAAILPLVTFINGALQNSRESQRLLTEQQDKIRQTYLDRVLKSGINEGEQQRIFGLLVKLKSDPELKEWATEELNKITIKVDQLTQDKISLELKNIDLLSQLEIERQNSIALVGEAKKLSQSKVRTLQMAALESEKKINELRDRIGEQVPPPINIEKPYIRGKILSDKGIPLPNAFVSLMQNGVSPKNTKEYKTEFNGEFKIELPLSKKLGDDINLIIHCEGYTIMQCVIARYKGELIEIPLVKDDTDYSKSQ